MVKLFSDAEFQSASSTDRLPLKCRHCNNVFLQTKKYITRVLKNNGKGHSADFCSKSCSNTFRNTQQHSRPNLDYVCKNCGHIFQDKCARSFCNRSCSAIYHNKNKTHGTRRSKLEVFIEKELTLLYPNLEIHFNRKDAINSELDIYIPSLKLAFELNGIFHYEPIYGVEKLTKIQTNDDRKFQACLEKNIELCIIDASSLKYFKEHNVRKFLDIVNEIIIMKTDK